MERNTTKEVVEKQRATNDERANNSKAGWFLRVGLPVCSSTPPGIVAEAAKATVATSAATTEQPVEVLASHSAPDFTRSLWVILKS